MIIVKLTGGLGNQMFQYAAGRRLALLRDVQLKLDPGGFAATASGDTPRSYALDAFRINACFAQPEEVSFQFQIKDATKAARIEATKAYAQYVEEPKTSQRRWSFDLELESLLCKPVSGFIQRGIRKLAETVLPGNRRACFKESGFKFNPEIMSLGNEVYLDGFWQSEKYFNDIRETIHQDFTVRQPLEGRNLELSELIAKTESVSLHVRRGDYVTNPATGQYHGVCPLDYYRQAIELVSGRTGAIRLYIFSDDPLWVRENLRPPCPATFVDHNGPDKGYEDLRLMSLCSHNIIANSSFSWWGAWLNRNPGKVVVAPANWFKQQDIDTSDLIPPGWHRI